MDDTITLKEKLEAGATIEERADLTLSLLMLNSNGDGIAYDPDEIYVDRNNKVTIKRNAEGINLCYQAPEVIEDAINSKYSSDTTTEQRLFTLGMLAYYIHEGANFYEKKSMSILSIPQYTKEKRYMIEADDLPSVPYGGAISKMTAIDPQQRRLGVTEFLQYITNHMPEKAVLRYICDGQEIKTETREIRNTVSNIFPEGKLTINNVKYQLTRAFSQIPYRPGTHMYDVEVKKISSAPQYKYSLHISKSYLTGMARDIDMLPPLLDLSTDSKATSITLRMSYPSAQFHLIRVKKGTKQIENVGSVVVPKPRTAGILEYKIDIKYTADTRDITFDVLTIGNERLAPVQLYKLP